jgi:hypothetical protein
MKNCLNCGSEVKKDDNFCKKCGAKQTINNNDKIKEKKKNIGKSSTLLLIIFGILGIMVFLSVISGLILSTMPIQEDINYESTYDENTVSESEDRNSSAANEENGKSQSNTNSHMTYIGSSSGEEQYAINTNGMYYYSGDSMIIVLANSNSVTHFIGAPGEYYMIKGDLVKIENGDLTYKGP